MISSALSILRSEQERSQLEEIYITYSNRFYAVAYSKLHNRYDAEDAVIEAFARISSNPEIFFKIPAHKKVSYIDVIIRNIAIDIYNKNHKTSTITYEEALDEPSADIQIDELVIGELSKNDLIEFIRSMPEGKKDALTLKVMYNHTTAEIAKILGITETAARKRLSDAGKMIKAFIEEEANNGV